MAVSRADRRRDRESKVRRVFSNNAAASQALDLLELVELAWHDCYGEITPSEEVVDDILVLGGDDLGKLIIAARLAVTDWRDLRVSADGVRERQRSQG
jgi:hypothetical protein